MTDFYTRLGAALADRYRLERELGQGGMATVFLAHDIKHDRKVAIKLLRPELASVLGVDRFLAEIKVTGNLQHPNLLPLFDSGEAGGLLYYVMPHVEGETLRARLERETQLPVDETLRLASFLASALDYAHARGVIHRDLKPENILLQAGQPVIADFGIALAVAQAGGSRITETGLLVGTPSYMSPEQAAGDRALDARSDQYALGDVTYEMLTGEPPHTGPTPQAIVARVMSETPRSVRATRANVPVSVERAINRALATLPADRFPTCGDFAQRLVATEVAAPSRRRARLVGAALLGLAVAALALWRARSPGRGAAVAPDRSIAVLPLANLSGDPSDDYFGIGLSEEITRALAKAGVRVVGRVSAGALFARGLDERAIARELGVGSLLTGSVQRAAGQLRISVALSAADGTVRWTQAYDRPISNVFVVQDEIAREVSRELLGSLGAAPGTLVRTETADPEAHSLLLQGIVLWNRRTLGSIRQAIGLFERAVARDPGYARAHAWLGMANSSLPFYAEVETEVFLDRALAAADRALAIDSTVAEAHAAAGSAAMTLGRNGEAEFHFRRALALDSTLAPIWYWSGILEARRSNFADARRHLRRAIELEPASLVSRVQYSAVLNSERAYAAADSAARSVLALDSSFVVAWLQDAEALAGLGRTDEAIDMMEQRVIGQPAPRPSEIDGVYAWILAHGGRNAAARAVLERQRAAHGGRLPPVAVLAATLEELGDHDAAVVVLGDAVRRHDPWLWFSRKERYDRLRADPRAAALLAQVERW